MCDEQYGSFQRCFEVNSMIVSQMTAQWQSMPRRNARLEYPVWWYLLQDAKQIRLAKTSIRVSIRQAFQACSALKAMNKELRGNGQWLEVAIMIVKQTKEMEGRQHSSH